MDPHAARRSAGEPGASPPATDLHIVADRCATSASEHGKAKEHSSCGGGEVRFVVVPLLALVLVVRTDERDIPGFGVS